MLGPSSDVKLTSDTILFVNLPYTNIHASHSQFSHPPGWDVNLTPEPGSTPNIALSSKHHGQKIPTSDSPLLVSKSALRRENWLFVSSNSRHPPLQEALQSHGGGARYVCVGS